MVIKKMGKVRSQREIDLTSRWHDGDLGSEPLLNAFVHRRAYRGKSEEMCNKNKIRKVAVRWRKNRHGLV